jgi:hypothetical protein
MIFNFWCFRPIVNFPFICSNIPAASAYGVYISQLIWYSSACGSYQDFLDRVLLLTGKPLKPVGELRCSGRGRSSCSTSDTRRFNLTANPVISHERGKDRWTSGTYSWPFVTQISHSGRYLQTLLIVNAFWPEWKSAMIPTMWTKIALDSIGNFWNH